jgi:hypothetical protein
MKYIRLCTIAFYTSLLPSSAADPRRESYVVAITLEKGKAIPATLTFSISDDENVVDLYLNGKKWTAQLTLRDVPELKGNAVTKMFDAVFKAEDGISSVTLTGRFFDYATGDGDGLIAIHLGAKIASEAGLPSIPASIQVGSLTIQALKAEQDAALKVQA